RRVSQSSGLRTCSILLFLRWGLQVLHGPVRVESARGSAGCPGVGDRGVSGESTRTAAWLPRRRRTGAATQTPWLKKTLESHRNICTLYELLSDRPLSLSKGRPEPGRPSLPRGRRF